MYTLPNLPDSTAREVYARLRKTLELLPADTPEASAARDADAMRAVAAHHPTDAMEARIAADIVGLEAYATDSLRLAGVHRSDLAATMQCRAQATSMFRQMRCLLRDYQRTQAARDKALLEMHPAAMERAGYWFREFVVPEPASEPGPDHDRGPGPDYDPGPVAEPAPRPAVPAAPTPGPRDRALAYPIGAPASTSIGASSSSPRSSSTPSSTRAVPRRSVPRAACRRTSTTARPSRRSSRAWSTAPARSCWRSTRRRWRSPRNEPGPTDAATVSRSNTMRRRQDHARPASSSWPGSAPPDPGHRAPTTAAVRERERAVPGPAGMGLPQPSVAPGRPAARAVPPSGTPGARR